jgi:hypothetical protein
MWGLLTRRKGLKRYSLLSHQIDPETIKELYRFYLKFVNTTFGLRGFRDIIEEYQHASIYRDRLSGGLRGMSFLDIKRDNEIMMENNKSYQFTMIRVC